VCSHNNKQKNFKNIKKNILPQNYKEIFHFILIGICSFFIASYVEMFFEAIHIYESGEYTGFLAGKISPVIIAHVSLIFIALLLLCYFFSKKYQKILRYCFKYRYLIGAIVVVLCLLFEINGSSLGYLEKILPGASNSVHLGIPRATKSDEWAVLTPLIASQEANHWQAISNILRATTTNVTIGYNLPSWSLVSLFRPDQWGYLLFGFSRGLSWFWSIKYVCCFLISFECARLYTFQNRWLSLAAAFLITFSPFTVWWNASQFFIYGQGLVLALHHYLYAHRIIVRSLCAVLIAWLCGCYFFTMYPAWMIPFFYIFALMGIWMLAKYRYAKANNGNLLAFSPRRDIILLCVPFFLVVLVVYICFASASSEVAATLSTVYPGERFETGGGLLFSLFNYGWNIFSPLEAELVAGTPSESATIFSLFPLGTISAVFIMLQHKKFDSLNGLMFFLNLIFIEYIVIGFPTWLSRITLMSNVPAARLIGPQSYIEIILLLRSIAIAYKTKSAFPLSEGRREKAEQGKYQFKTIIYWCMVISFGLAVLSWKSSNGFLHRSFFILDILVLAALTTFIVLAIIYGNKIFICMFSILISLIVGISGVCVNPIQIGTGQILGSDFAQAVSEVLKTDSTSKWLIVDGRFQTSNLTAAIGAPTINCTNMIPNISLWKRIDPNGEFLNAYNRYAHIPVALSNSATSSFNLMQFDTCALYLSYRDLKTLDVKFIVGGDDIGDLQLPGVAFLDIGRGNGLVIYQVIYTNSL
jgi:hypothetical protein